MKCENFVFHTLKLKSSEKDLLKNNHEQVIIRYESTDNKPSEREYIESKQFLENLIQERTKGAILRSKCQWYEDGEKSSKFFMKNSCETR